MKGRTRPFCIGKKPTRERPVVVVTDYAVWRCYTYLYACTTTGHCAHNGRNVHTRSTTPFHVERARDVRASFLHCALVKFHLRAATSCSSRLQRRGRVSSSRGVNVRLPFFFVPLRYNGHVAARVQKSDDGVVAVMCSVAHNNTRTVDET